MARAAPSLAASAGPVRKQATVPRLPSPLEAEASDQELLRQVVGYYHATLRESPEAQRYLEQRGLFIERFQLGFANRTLGLRLPPKQTKAGEELRSRPSKITSPPGRISSRR